MRASEGSGMIVIDEEYYKGCKICSEFRPSGVLAIALLLTLALALPAPAGAAEQYAAAIHVHSEFSNGVYSVEELAALAEARGLDVLVLSDSYLTEVVYGLWPLDRTGIPGFNKVVRPAVMDHGIGEYLEAVEAARRKHPELVIVAGVEAAPSYYWTGRPWSGLALHDFDRHIQVYGLGEDDLLDLPVAGNERWSNTDFRWRMLLLPLALLGAGAAAFRVRTGGKRRLWRTGAILVLLGLAGLWNNWPYGALHDPYSGIHDDRPYRHLVDRVRERGGITYWSYPEARYPDVMRGRARMVSRPHPEDLLAIDRYDGFEGLYGDEITATLPGAEWDTALNRYLGGARERPPFVITGIDYHGPRVGGDRWDDLDGGMTFLLLEEKSERAVLEALRTGSGYATFQGYDEKFRLEEFSVCTGDGECATHGGAVRGSSPVALAVSMDWVEGPPPADNRFTLEIVRNGEVVEKTVAELPVAWRAVEQLEPGRYYFRLRAEAGRLNRALSNPVFVTVE